MRKFIIIAILSMMYLSMNAQVAYHEGLPYSKKKGKSELLPKEKVAKKIIPDFTEKEKKEWAESMKKEGKVLESHLLGRRLNSDFFKYATKEKLRSGEKLYRLNLSVENGSFQMYYFDKFYIPEGGQVYFYSETTDHVYGPLTSENNRESGKFMTGQIIGSDIIMEYLEPKAVKEKAEFVIRSVGFAKKLKKRINSKEKAEDKVLGADFDLPNHSFSDYDSQGNFKGYSAANLLSDLENGNPDYGDVEKEKMVKATCQVISYLGIENGKEIFSWQNGHALKSEHAGYENEVIILTCAHSIPSRDNPEYYKDNTLFRFNWYRKPMGGAFTNPANNNKLPIAYPENEVWEDTEFGAVYDYIGCEKLIRDTEDIEMIYGAPALVRLIEKPYSGHEFFGIPPHDLFLAGWDARSSNPDYRPEIPTQYYMVSHKEKDLMRFTKDEFQQYFPYFIDTSGSSNSYSCDSYLKEYSITGGVNVANMNTDYDYYMIFGQGSGGTGFFMEYVGEDSPTEKRYRFIGNTFLLSGVQPIGMELSATFNTFGTDTNAISDFLTNDKVSKSISDGKYYNHNVYEIQTIKTQDVFPSRHIKGTQVRFTPRSSVMYNIDLSIQVYYKGKFTEKYLYEDSISNYTLYLDTGFMNNNYVIDFDYNYKYDVNALYRLVIRNGDDVLGTKWIGDINFSSSPLHNTEIIDNILKFDVFGYSAMNQKYNILKYSLQDYSSYDQEPKIMNNYPKSVIYEPGGVQNNPQTVVLDNDEAVYVVELLSSNGNVEGRALCYYSCSLCNNSAPQFSVANPISNTEKVHFVVSLVPSGTQDLQNSRYYDLYNYMWPPQGGGYSYDNFRNLKPTVSVTVNNNTVDYLIEKSWDYIWYDQYGIKHYGTMEWDRGNFIAGIIEIPYNTSSEVVIDIKREDNIICTKKYMISRDANGNFQKPIILDESNTISEPSNISVYPNPSTGNSTIHFEELGSEEPVSIKLYDINGNLVKDVYNNFEGLETNDIPLDVNELSSGTYLLEIFKDGLLYTKSVVVAK